MQNLIKLNFKIKKYIVLNVILQILIILLRLILIQLYVHLFHILQIVQHMKFQLILKILLIIVIYVLKDFIHKMLNVHKEINLIQIVKFGKIYNHIVKNVMMGIF